MHTARMDQAVTLLTDGRVLITGGETGSAALASAEIYDPATNNWSDAGHLSGPRSRHQAVRLPDGAVLIAGGTDGTKGLGTLELFTPAPRSMPPDDFSPVAAPETAAQPAGPHGPDGPNRRYFRQSRHTPAGPFLQFWRQHLGAQVLGLPLTEPFTKGGLQLQYCERGLLQRSGDTAILAPLGRMPAPHDVTGNVFAVASLFAKYYAQHQGPLLFGRAITDVHFEPNNDGSGLTYPVQ